LLTASPAAAQGLSRARSVMDSFRSELLTIIPIVAVVALIVLGILYATKAVEFRSLMRWFVGVIIVGSASSLVAMLIG
jgi:type IV secretory pathway VirB2 component (pilin)